MTYNKEQDEVIRTIEGILVVDAGPGTGKTYTITRRYMHILETEEDITPKDILLLTFTRNAAESMREKILNKLVDTKHGKSLLDVNVSTFHAFCNKILSIDPTNAPRHLGLEEPLSRGYKIVENEVLEHMFFNNVYADFKDQHFERYSTIFCAIRDKQREVRSIIARLLSKGIYPTSEGWFLNGEALLDGDRDAFIENAMVRNTPNTGKSGRPTNSDLYNAFNDIKNAHCKDLPDDAFSTPKQVSQTCIDKVFEEDRDLLKAFVHDIYYAYIRQSVQENHLSFEMLSMFAFLQLYHDHELRSSLAFPYVMIDEFQDTNEMQLYMTLLLMAKPNLCVVGDWKQGIYGFRNATIENILQFPEKYYAAVETLNRGHTRVPFTAEPELKGFVLNFRSSQELLDFSPQALLTPASASEELNVAEINANIIRLAATAEFGTHTGISFYRAATQDEEVDMVLSIIQDMALGGTYLIKDGETYRPPHYQDIAVLTRTREFGLKLLEKGRQSGVPARYDGGIELFNTDEGSLLLAWLRVLTNRADKRGWVTLLELHGCTPQEKKTLLRDGTYPKELVLRRKKLLSYTANIVELITAVFSDAKVHTAFSEAIIHTVRTLFDAYPLSTEQLIRYIEDNITNNETYSVDLVTAIDAATIQTIHGSKGLEYPIVILADCNEGRFPSRMGDASVMFLDDVAGLRCTKEYGYMGEYCDIFENWRTTLVKAARTKSNDEERRLLFVALTRAKQYIVMTASRKPSLFFSELCIEESVAPPLRISNEAEQPSPCALPPLEGIEKRGKAVLSPHDIMGPLVTDDGKGAAYGTKVHHMAERMVRGMEVERAIEPAFSRIASLLETLRGARLCAEVDCILPLAGHMVRGTIDLIADYGDHFEILDYKTDLGLQNLERYRIQLSVYYHSARGHFGYDGSCALYFVELDKKEKIEPLSIEELEEAAKLYAGV